MNRIINVDISDEYCKVSNKVAGASGSHNSVDLEFTFNEAWEGTSKKVYFFNALGLNPVTKLLMPEDVAENGNYRIGIPSEPLEFAGKMRMTVKGVVLDEDNKTEKVMVSTSYDFDVLEGKLPDTDTEPTDVTPTQAEQLLSEIDEIKEDLVNVKIVSDSVDICTEKANIATASAENAKTSETNAKYWADKAKETAGGDFVTPTDLATHNTAETAHTNLFSKKVDKIAGTTGNMVSFGANGAMADSGIAFSVVNGILNVTYEEG